MKKIKSISTLFVAFVLVVSMLGTNVFAATVFDGNSIPVVNEVLIPDVAIEQTGYGGKSVDDAYYAVNAKSSSFQTGFYPLGGGNTLELQFALSDASSVFVVYPRMYRDTPKDKENAGSYHRLEVDSAGMRYYGGDYSAGSKTMLWSEKVDIIPGRWYSLVAKFQDDSASEGQRDQEFYLNGELVHRGDGLTDYGFRNLAVGPKNAAHGVYIDNIIQTNNRGVSSSETHVIDINRMKTSALTAVGTSVEVNEELGKVIILPETTVGELKNGITSENTDDVIKVYNTDLATLASNNDEAIGKVIVVASKNGTNTEQAYNYYNIDEIDFDLELGRGGNASELVSHQDAVTAMSVPGIFGKKASDDVYKLSRSSGDGISLANTFINQNLFKISDYTQIEFDFMIDSGATLGARIAYFTSPTDTNSHESQQVNFLVGKTTSGSGLTGDPKSADIKPNTWYKVGITVPKNSSSKDTIKVYLNGKLLREFPVALSYGLRRPFIVPYNMGDSYVYLDNLVIRNDGSFDYNNDLSSWLDIDNAIIKGDKIRYTVMPQASDFHPGANTNVRFYDADWNRLADTDGAAYVVAGEKDAAGYETRISYYTFDSSAKDYIAGGYYDKDNNFYVKAYGKNAGDSLYYATYESANKDELSEVVAGVMNTADNKAEISGTFGDKPYRFFFWDKDINPLVKSIALELKK